MLETDGLDNVEATNGVLPERSEPDAWSVTQEANVRKALARAFYEKPDMPLPADKEPERFVVINSSYTMGVEALSPRARAALRPFLNWRQPTLPAMTAPKPGACCIGLDFLDEVVRVLRASRDKKVRGLTRACEVPAILSAHNWPLTIATHDWRFVIAPLITEVD